jgi:hypothetical protein
LTDDPGSSEDHLQPAIRGDGAAELTEVYRISLDPEVANIHAFVA